MKEKKYDLLRQLRVLLKEIRTRKIADKITEMH